MKKKLRARRSSAPRNSAEETLAQVFALSHAHFGDAVKSHWLHDGDGCPGCGREISAVRWKGQDVISLNTFIYRRRGVLIGYLLCGTCGEYVMRAGQDPLVKHTELHDVIEQTLIQAYERYLRSLPA
jgi:hypothetical protein